MAWLYSWDVWNMHCVLRSKKNSDATQDCARFTLQINCKQLARADYLSALPFLETNEIGDTIFLGTGKGYSLSKMTALRAYLSVDPLIIIMTLYVQYQEAPVFHLTEEDMKLPFEEVFERYEDVIKLYGVGKFVTPSSFNARKSGYQDAIKDLMIEKPLKQIVHGAAGVYRFTMTTNKNMPCLKFKDYVSDRSRRMPENLSGDSDQIERRFWRELQPTREPAVYGADLEGSLFDPHIENWNVSKLNTWFHRTLAKKGINSIPGVTTPYLYFGSWRATFAFHTEDMDLASINYLHDGAPKTWYVVPPDDRNRFESLVKNNLAKELFSNCPEYLRHKELLIKPTLLLKEQIRVIRVQQERGSYIVNYPGAYHAGFNHGWNIAEATNFATESWVPIGQRAGVCRCSADSVRIQMDLFKPDPVNIEDESDTISRSFGSGPSNSGQDSDDEGTQSDLRQPSRSSKGVVPVFKSLGDTNMYGKRERDEEATSVPRSPSSSEGNISYAPHTSLGYSTEDSNRILEKRERLIEMGLIGRSEISRFDQVYNARYFQQSQRDSR